MSPGVFYAWRIDRVRYYSSMKNTIRNTVVSLLLVAGSVAYGGVPALKVTVSDASGKAAYKGTTSNGTFATPNLKAGNYVVQLNSKSAPTKGSHYAIIVSAGKKKVSATGV